MGKRDAAALRAIYADLPTVDCVGECWPTCGPVYPEAVFQAERRILARLVGRRKQQGPALLLFSARVGREVPACEFLDPIDKRCTIYEKRPLVCRLWGAADEAWRDFHCKHGCTVTPARLSQAEASVFMARARALTRGQRRGTTQAT